MVDLTAVNRSQYDRVREELCDEIVCRMQSRVLGRMLRYLHDHPADAEPILRRVFLVYCDWLADGHLLDTRTRMALETYRGFVEGSGNADTLTLARKQAKIAARALRKEDRGPASVSRFIARYVREASRNNAWESWYHVVGHRGGQG